MQNTQFSPLVLADRIDATGPCWLWLGYINNKGYGQVGFDGRMYLIHRLIWEMLVSPLLDGMQVDHFCRVRHCCNPDHLDPVTQTTNMARIPDLIRGGRRTDTCRRGHSLDDAYTFARPDGKPARKCRTCTQLHNAGLL